MFEVWNLFIYLVTGWYFCRSQIATIQARKPLATTVKKTAWQHIDCKNKIDKAKKMAIFEIEKGKAKRVRLSEFKLEKDLQRIIEENIETVFNCRLIATEFSTGNIHSGRIDVTRKQICTVFGN
jgi:hypothetical protein